MEFIFRECGGADLELSEGLKKGLIDDFFGAAFDDGEVLLGCPVERIIWEEEEEEVVEDEEVGEEEKERQKKENEQERVAEDEEGEWDEVGEDDHEKEHEQQSRRVEEDEDPPPVQIVLGNGGGVIEADHVIITVSVGCLKAGQRGILRSHSDWSIRLGLGTQLSDWLICWTTGLYSSDGFLIGPFS